MWRIDEQATKNLRSKKKIIKKLKKIQENNLIERILPKDLKNLKKKK